MPAGWAAIRRFGKGKREAGANPARSRHCDKGACRQGAFAPVTEHCLGRRRRALSFQPGNLPAVGTGALLQITRNWLYLKSSWKIRGLFVLPFCMQKAPLFFAAVWLAKPPCLGFVPCTCFSVMDCNRRKEAKHMKRNNLKKPAAVLTALALAAAPLTAQLPAAPPPRARL